MKAETLIVGGTGGALGVIKILAAEYIRLNPEISINVFPSLGSGGGIKTMMKGLIDINITARNLDKKEQDKGLVEVELGKTPFIIVTSKEGNEVNVSMSELAGIFYG